MHIAITNVTKQYRRGTRALDHLSLTIPGGLFGLLGTNGAGKTTLIRMLATLIKPTSGTVHVGGHDLGERSGRQAVRRALGYLPQNAGVYPDLTARQFLDYIALLKGLDRGPDRRRQVGAMLEVVALSAHADQRLRTFSGGMGQRVGIAQALLGDPQLLIVDEPTAGLDPQERVRFRTLLSELASDRTVLLSTHIVEDIAQTTRNVAVLDTGQLRFTGTVQELTATAQGRVWTTVASTPPPGSTVISAVTDGPTTRYRLLSPEKPADTAQLTEPTLEDGYLTLTTPPHKN